eukprot:6987928-Lingulodinium_polyedra.AAC.1
MPQLAAVSYRQHERPRASKRDARHFFHVLKSGRAWRPFFAGRHVLQRGKRVYPASRVWPTGFRGSATVAQAVTEACAVAV